MADEIAKPTQTLFSFFTAVIFQRNLSIHITEDFGYDTLHKHVLEMFYRNQLGMHQNWLRIILRNSDNNCKTNATHPNNTSHINTFLQ